MSAEAILRCWESNAPIEEKRALASDAERVKGECLYTRGNAWGLVRAARLTLFRSLLSDHMAITSQPKETADLTPGPFPLREGEDIVSLFSRQRGLGECRTVC